MASFQKVTEDWWEIDDGSGVLIDLNSVRYHPDGSLTEGAASGLDGKHSPLDIDLCPGTGQRCSVTIKQGNTTWSFNEFKKPKAPNWIKI